jgi:hypothetical protein
MPVSCYLSLFVWFWFWFRLDVSACLRAGHASDRPVGLPVWLRTWLVRFGIGVGVGIQFWFWLEVMLAERLIRWIQWRGRKKKRWKNILVYIITLGAGHAVAPVSSNTLFIGSHAALVFFDVTRLDCSTHIV